MPAEFEGLPEQYHQLRNALKAAKHSGITPQELIDLSGCQISRSALIRFRDAKTEKLNHASAGILWKHIAAHLPFLHSYASIDVFNPYDSDGLFPYLREFFDLKQHRINQFREQFTGTYEVFARSEIFWNERKVVRARWQVSESKTGALILEEHQAYDGRFGLSPLKEDYYGYCMPKSGKEVFLLRRSIGYVPKVYFTTDRIANGFTNKFDYFSGFLVSFSSRWGGFFQTNFYARRTPDELWEPEILSKDDIEDERIRNAVFPFDQS